MWEQTDANDAPFARSLQQYDNLGRQTAPGVKRTINGVATVSTYDDWKAIVEWNGNGGRDCSEAGRPASAPSCRLARGCVVGAATIQWLRTCIRVRSRKWQHSGTGISMDEKASRS